MLLCLDFYLIVSKLMWPVDKLKGSGRCVAKFIDSLEGFDIVARRKDDGFSEISGFVDEDGSAIQGDRLGALCNPFYIDGRSAK